GGSHVDVVLPQHVAEDGEEVAVAREQRAFALGRHGEDLAGPFAEERLRRGEEAAADLLEHAVGVEEDVSDGHAGTVAGASAAGHAGGPCTACRYAASFSGLSCHDSSCTPSSATATESTPTSTPSRTMPTASVPLATSERVVTPAQNSSANAESSRATFVRPWTTTRATCLTRPSLSERETTSSANSRSSAATSPARAAARNASRRARRSAVLTVLRRPDARSLRARLTSCRAAAGVVSMIRAISGQP